MGTPSTAEYIAIGETVMRFSSLISRSLKGANIGGAALFVRRRRALPEPALDAFQPFAIAQAKVLVADTLAARQQRISKLQRLEMEIAVERLEPFGRVTRAVLELEHFDFLLGLIFVERGCKDSPFASGAKQAIIAMCRVSFSSSKDRSQAPPA